MITRHLHFLLFIFSLLIFSCQSSTQKTSSMEEVRFLSKIFDQSEIIEEKRFSVFLPKNYYQNEKKDYPVLYFMDAQNLFVDSLAYGGFSWRMDRVVDSLVNENKIEEVIIVAIDHAGVKRFSEYMPQKPIEKLPKSTRDSLRNIIEYPIYSDKFLKFLTQELKPSMDSMFRTKSEVEHTFVGGSSMGGLISMYALCEYPQVFGGAMCFSTHWIVAYDDSKKEASESLISYFSKKLPKEKKWYFDFGTEGLDHYYEPWQKQIDSILQKNNYVMDEDWMTRKFVGHNHNERFWNSRLHIPFEFFFEKN